MNLQCCTWSFLIPNCFPEREILNLFVIRLALCSEILFWICNAENHISTCKTRKGCNTQQCCSPFWFQIIHKEATTEQQKQRKRQLTIAAAVIFAVMAVVIVSIWVYKDAKQRGLSAGMWTFLVVLSGTFIGLILYLLIGRKQRYGVCDKCGAAINIQGAFCPKCGETIVESKRIVTKNKGLLYVSIAFVTLVFVLIGIGIYTYRTVGGFAPLYKYEIHSGNIRQTNSTVHRNHRRWFSSTNHRARWGVHQRKPCGGHVLLWYDSFWNRYNYF